MLNTDKNDVFFVILILCIFILFTLVGLYISVVRWE